MQERAASEHDDERRERIAARLHAAGVMALNLYRMLGVRASASQAEVDDRIAALRRTAAGGRLSERATRGLPLVARVLGDPDLRAVYDRELQLMAEYRAAEAEQAGGANAEPRPPRSPAGRPGALERIAAQRAMLRGEVELALAYGEDAMDADPSAASAVTLAGVLRKAGRPADAERVARQALSLPGAGPETTLCLVRALADQGRREEALALAQETVRVAPDAPGAQALVRRLRVETVAPGAGTTGAG